MTQSGHCKAADANKQGGQNKPGQRGGQQQDGQDKPGQQGGRNANFKIKGPTNARPFLVGGSTIQLLRRLPLPH
jgi:hypothetical protein